MWTTALRGCVVWSARCRHLSRTMGTAQRQPPPVVTSASRRQGRAVGRRRGGGGACHGGGRRATPLPGPLGAGDPPHLPGRRHTDLGRRPRRRGVRGGELPTDRATAALSRGRLAGKTLPPDFPRSLDGGAARRRLSRPSRITAAGAGSRRSGGSGRGRGRSARQRSPVASSRRRGAAKQETSPPRSPAALRRQLGATALVAALAHHDGWRWFVAGSGSSGGGGGRSA